MKFEASKGLEQSGFDERERNAFSERFRLGKAWRLARALVLMSVLAGPAIIAEGAPNSTQEAHSQSQKDQERESKNQERWGKFNTLLQAMELPRFTIGPAKMQLRCPCETLGVYLDGNHRIDITSEGFSFEQSSFQEAINRILLSTFEGGISQEKLVDYGPGAKEALEQQGVVLVIDEGSEIERITVRLEGDKVVVRKHKLTPASSFFIQVVKGGVVVEDGFRPYD